jgi:protein SCO1/2
MFTGRVRALAAVFAMAAALSYGLPVPSMAASSSHSRPQGVDLETLFKLSTHEGGHLGRNDLRGKPVLLFFGYTHCPDVCPTSLLDMTLYLRELGADADRVKVIFVTVDPQRDTVETLQQYLSNFDGRITGLTGSLGDVEAVAKTMGASMAQGDESNGYYSVDHSASTFLIDRYGLLAQVVPYRDHKGLAEYSKRLLAQ